MLTQDDFKNGLLVTLDTESQTNYWLADTYPEFVGQVGEVYAKKNGSGLIWVVWWPGVRVPHGKEHQLDGQWYAGALRLWKKP